MVETVPGSYDVEALSKVYVDGLEVGALVDALEENQRLIGAQKSASERQFWSSPRRAASDTTREVYEVSLNAARRVNFITFDLARFPQRWALFYRSGSSGEWITLKAKSGRRINGRITDSIPAIITPPPPGSTEHPQHYGAGHWVRREFDLQPVTARQFRLVMYREVTPKSPTDRAFKKVSYSLGVRAFEIGYKVKGRDDIPATPRNPVIVTERESFASTTDILGSPVSLSVRENRAQDLLKGAMWRSEPQPIPNAVVNLYVDARDGSGEAQTIDRFYLEPTTSGAAMNLYYSNDNPDQIRFSASDNPLDFPLTQAHGSAATTSSGLVFPHAFGFVDLDNAGVQLNPRRPFWVGVTLNPMFDSDDTEAHPILDSALLQVDWVADTLRVNYAGNNLTYQRQAISETEGDPGVIVPMFKAGEELAFAVGFDGTSVVLHIDGHEVKAPARSSTYVMPQPKTASGMTSYLRVGGYSVPENGDPGYGAFRLTSLIVKAEPPVEQEVAEAFFADPKAFVDGGQQAPTVDTSDNALVRYLPSYQTGGPETINPLGFIGGPGNRYEDLVWTPINRDFRLAKGYVVFNPTKAKYFKFEFTGLVAQPYDEYAPITRKVKVFSTAQTYRRAVVTSSKNTVRGAVPAAKSAASTLFFSDQARLYSLRRPEQPSSDYIPTVGVYSTDAKVAERLREKSLYLNLQAWHSRTFTPRFVDVQKHVYETVEVQHTQRVAYFVGLSKIEMSRVDYVVDDDTEQYLEPFSDPANLVVDEDGALVGGWSLDEGWLATPDSLGIEDEVVATSKVFASRRKVTAIQFATQQTPPVQILPDPDLDDPTLLHWRGMGDAKVTPSDEFATDIGTMALVERDSSANFWNVIEDRFANWDAIEEAQVTWDDLEASGSSNPQGGLTAAATFEVSSEGRLYAAARVYATEELSAPLYVQVVDELGKVLSEEPVTVKAGQVAEWYTSYTIGEGGALVGLSWDDVEAVGTWNQVEALGTWDDVSQTSLEHVGRVTARIVQTEPTSDSWYVDNLSLFDDAIIWEFSRDGGKTFYPAYDIRNDPRGVFVFPSSGTDGDGHGLVWRVKGTRGNQRVDYLAIRPWYDSLPSGQPHRETIQVGGPNQALIDHYPPITEDPRWKVWSKPIPEEWWFVFRQWLLDQRPTPEVDSTIVVPNSIVPVDEGIHQEEALALAGQVVLESAVDEYTHPDYPDFYPFGPTTTAVLSDGTYFVAVMMHTNVQGTGVVQWPIFVRTWHLDANLNVLGTHDEPMTGAIGTNGNPEPLAIAVEGNQVLLLSSGAFDGGFTAYADAIAAGRMVDDGTGYVAVTGDPGVSFVGANTRLNQFPSLFDNQTSYVQLSGATTALVTSRAAPSYDLDRISLPNVAITEVEMRLSIWSDTPVVEDIEWRIVDDSLPYGADTITSGNVPYLPIMTNLGGQYFVASAWSTILLPLTLTEGQREALRQAMIGGTLRLAVTPGASGVRRLSGMNLKFSYGRDDV